MGEGPVAVLNVCAEEAVEGVTVEDEEGGGDGGRVGCVEVVLACDCGCEGGGLTSLLMWGRGFGGLSTCL